MESRTSDNWLWLVLAMVLAVGLVAVVAAAAMPYGAFYGMMGGWMGWGAIFMIVPAVIFVLVLLAALGVGPASDRYAHTTYVPAPTSAIEALNARFARGEISREEYLRMRGDFQGRSA